MTKKLVKIETTPLDVVDLIQDLTMSLITTLPAYLNPVAGLLATASTFSGLRITKMGLEVQEFLKSKEAEKKKSDSTPHEKLYETLHFLSNNGGAGDKEYIEALRNLHVLSFSEKLNEPSEVTELYLLLETARRLTGMEVTILLAAYRMYERLYTAETMNWITANAKEGVNTGYVERWAEIISRASGLSNWDYVLRYQTHLEEFNLIVSRSPDNKFGLQGLSNTFPVTGKCRLTPSGYKLAELIVKGGEVYSQAVPEKD